MATVIPTMNEFHEVSQKATEEFTVKDVDAIFVKAYVERFGVTPEEQGKKERNVFSLMKEVAFIHDLHIAHRARVLSAIAHCKETGELETRETRMSRTLLAITAHGLKDGIGTLRKYLPTDEDMAAWTQGKPTAAPGPEAYENSSTGSTESDKTA